MKIQIGYLRDATRCPQSDLPAYSCAHCRPDVKAKLAADPVFAAWLTEAETKGIDGELDERSVA